MEMIIFCVDSLVVDSLVTSLAPPRGCYAVCSVAARDEYSYSNVSLLATMASLLTVVRDSKCSDHLLNV